MLRCTEGLKAIPVANVQILYLLQNKCTKTQGDKKFRTFVTWSKNEMNNNCWDQNYL